MIFKMISDIWLNRAGMYKRHFVVLSYIYTHVCTHTHTHTHTYIVYIHTDTVQTFTLFTF